MRDVFPEFDRYTLPPPMPERREIADLLRRPDAIDGLLAGLLLLYLHEK